MCNKPPASYPTGLNLISDQSVLDCGGQEWGWDRLFPAYFRFLLVTIASHMICIR